MSLLDRVLLARAEEQSAAALREPGHWEPADRDAAPRPVVQRRTRCLAGDCDRPLRAHGYCWMHLQRIRKTGTVEELIRPAAIVRRLRRLDFLRRVA